VLYGPRGIKELDYFWNLGISTNNTAKAYAVYQGVQLALQKHPTKLNIVGDSKNTIRYFVIGSNPKEIKLKSLIERTRLSLSYIFVQFFHILRENNKEADEMANKAIGLAPGSLGVCG
jgi:ribonuclease HI